MWLQRKRFFTLWEHMRWCDCDVSMVVLYINSACFIFIYLDMWRKLWRKRKYIIFLVNYIRIKRVVKSVQSIKWQAMMVVRHRQVCRRFTLIFTPVVRAPCFMNSKLCGIDVVRRAYAGKLSYDRLWIDTLRRRTSPRVDVRSVNGA